MFYASIILDYFFSILLVFVLENIKQSKQRADVEEKYKILIFIVFVIEFLSSVKTLERNQQHYAVSLKYSFAHPIFIYW